VPVLSCWGAKGTYTAQQLLVLRAFDFDPWTLKTCVFLRLLLLLCVQGSSATTPGLGGVARAVQQWVQLLTAAVEVLGPEQVQESSNLGLPAFADDLLKG
jgi:hypothetical protein